MYRCRKCGGEDIVINIVGSFTSEVYANDKGIDVEFCNFGDVFGGFFDVDFMKHEDYRCDNCGSTGDEIEDIADYEMEEV